MLTYKLKIMVWINASNWLLVKASVIILREYVKEVKCSTLKFVERQRSEVPVYQLVIFKAERRKFINVCFDTKVIHF